MTTQSWSSRIRHDSDATFREWGSDFAARLLAVGLVQTADTGQINWATVTRPAANTEGGFETWAFNDTEQGTAPIFLRVGYGTGTGATNPRIQITVGTGTNGSGTLTGTALTAARNVHGGAAQTTDTARQSYMCAVDGFFGFNWKVGASASEAGFFICRSCNSSGTPNAAAGMVHWGSGSSGVITARQALRFAATAEAYTATLSLTDGAFGINPQARNTTVVGSDIQVMMGWTVTPRVEPLFGVCGVISTELAPGGTFTATLVGSASRTFLTMTPVASGGFGPISASSTGGLCIAMIWE